MEAPVRVTDPAQMYWYKDAIVYELHVRAFYDSNADGIGDLRGLIQKLDYLQDLGVTALWLLPFYPSPLRDDGYDIADYRGINPRFGSLRDFRQFVRACHERGLRLITGRGSHGNTRSMDLLATLLERKALGAVGGSVLAPNPKL